LIKHHDVIIARLKLLCDRLAIMLGGKSRTNHRETAQESEQPGVWSAGDSLPADAGLEGSSAVWSIIGIFQAQENNIGALARCRSRQLSGINTITRIEWNGYRSAKPEDRKGQLELRREVLS
jgi:hypothetical protein